MFEAKIQPQPSPTPCSDLKSYRIIKVLYVITEWLGLSFNESEEKLKNKAGLDK